MTQTALIVSVLLLLVAAGGHARTSPTPADSNLRAAQPPAPAPGRPVLILTPRDVAHRILNDSDRAKEVNYNADLIRLPYAQVLSKYDFSVYFETGYQRSKVESVGGNASSDMDQSNLTTFTLQKSFSTGTTAHIEFTRNQTRYDLLATAPVTFVDRYTQNIAGLTLTQNLWGNFFGMADRAEVSSAEKYYMASRVTRANDLQTLVLEALEAYWTAYVAQETFQESLSSRDRYEKLVSSIRRKSSFGYSSPGELPQIQAEFEIRQQTVKTASANYLQALDSLATLLRIPPGTEIQFQSSEELPPPPKLGPVEIDKLRAVKSARLRKEAAESSYDGSKSRNRADLSLVGKVYTSGLDETDSGADNEFLAGTRPRSYVGIRYQYTFGSGLREEDILNKKLTKDLEATRFERMRLETSDQLLNLERQIQANYNVAVSSKNQRVLREKAINELNRTYAQGRTDIAILIEAMNKYFNSEIDLIRSIGNYQIALNRFAALRDELIPDPSVPNANVQTGMPVSEEAPTPGGAR
ncbi:MAG: TolC family protein [Bdellovibrio sp.]